MKVKYIGESFGVSGLTNGKIYECLGVEDAGDFGPMLRIIDDDLDDRNYDDSPDWKPGYLYSPFIPAPLDGRSSGGIWEIVEDDDKGTLNRLINGADRMGISKEYAEELNTEIEKVKAKVADGTQPIFDSIDSLFDELES